MFHASADAIWSGRLAAYPDRFDNADLTGDEVTLTTHVDIELTGGLFVGGFNCDVDLTHDGDDWAITGVSYSSDFVGRPDDFDVPALRQRAPDGSLKDCLRREVLSLIDRQYNELADAATLKARAA